MSPKSRMTGVPVFARNLLASAVLAALVSACGSDNNSKNQAPEVKAGDNITVDENVRVSLTGSASDADGSITAFTWKQLSGPAALQLSDVTQESISFVAPAVNQDQQMVFELSAEDDQGLVSRSQVSVTVKDVSGLLINNVSPQFGTAGSMITVASNAIEAGAMKVVLGEQIVETTVNDAGVLSFAVPEGAVSGPVYLENATGRSNAVWFSVSENGLLAPGEADLITDSNGVEYVTSYLVVTLKAGSSSLETAQRLASGVSGSVIGKYEDLRWWQIAVDAESMAELETLSAQLAADDAVENVTIDSIASGETLDWSSDPQMGQQRDRNNIEQGAALYASQVSLTDAEKALPFFMAVGVSEQGVDLELPDFSGYSSSNKNATTNITLFSGNKSSSATEKMPGNHGSNVVGLIAGELGDAGNAGLLSALGDTHSGANIRVDSGSGTVTGRIISTIEMIKNGASVINWSWGIHRQIAVDSNENGAIEQEEITAGALMCDGLYTNNNVRGQSTFNAYKNNLENFFNLIKKDYPNVVIVASAGNGATSASDLDNRLPSSISSDQLIVVASHSSGAQHSETLSEDDAAASGYSTSCFDTAITTDVKRSHYSNYGERVDIAASGTIVGFENFANAGKWGTSYAAPVVTATVALMQSINPNLSPAEIKQLLRSSALPVENKVLLPEGATDVFTRALTADESADHAGKGARLNVEGAVQAALNSLDDSTLSQSPVVPVEIGGDVTEVTKTIEVTLPGDQSVFDKVDVMFVVDVSGSYSDDLSTFQSKAGELIDAFSASGSNVNIGVSSFSDYPQSPYGNEEDYPFRLDQPLTNDYSLISATLDGLDILDGNDIPESQLEALYQTAQADTGWRSGALPAIFLATDAEFHDSDENDQYPGVGYAATLQALQERKARVYGLQSGGSIADVVNIAEATDGEAFNLSRDSSEIVEAVTSALDSASSDLSITLQPYGDFSGAVKSIKPTDNPGAENGAPIENVNPGDTIRFDVTFTRGSLPETGTHTIAFRLLVSADDVAVIQEIPVVLTVN